MNQVNILEKLREISSYLASMNIVCLETVDKYDYGLKRFHIEHLENIALRSTDAEWGRNYSYYIALVDEINSRQKPPN
jgi:hypothetical protein